MIVDGLYFAIPAALAGLFWLGWLVAKRYIDKPEGRHTADDTATLAWIADVRMLTRYGYTWRATAARARYAALGALITHAQASLGPFPPSPGEPRPGTAAAAGASPGLPPLPDPVPQVDHDEYGPKQRFHYGPPDPAAAVEQPAPQALPPPPAHHTAIAVGAMIAATHAHIAAAQAARAAELEAEARQTRPWKDDTGTFTAICTEVA